MLELIRQLVLEKKEGDWWDFKQQHHSNLLDLLHDILCMANIIYEGERYIIFGVTDDYEIIGLNNDNVRYSQADILNFLRTKSFANYKIPELKLDTVFIDGKEIDILTIANAAKKPYYLTKDETKKGSTVRAGVVYSRLQDSNTPKTSCATPYEIEAMWRERFGLTKKASDRFSDILLDYNNWKYDGLSKAFYDIDPDYTMEIDGDEESGGKFWWEEGLFEKPDKFYYLLKYKSIPLHKILIVRFRSENLEFPFPRIEYVTHPDANDGYNSDIYCDLFYFEKGSIEFSLFKHIRALEVEFPSEKSYSFPIETQIKPPIIELPFLLVDNEQHLNEITSQLLSSFIDFKEEKKANIEIKEFDDPILKRYAYERSFSEWAFRVVNEKCV
ncbi:ATP-binding protein [Litoribacillus peritrichatus]|uniref:Schlafen AlbA-2 domain-containing protein n=1 Tax=Litoribacillus peritrichatus TaxID=718191 RepID=A0ABP7MAJ3_9GAMM